MFDGVEMGLTPIVSHTALQDLLNVTDDGVVAWWNGRIVACFLFGTATGGLAFGWLGDKVGRVRAMILSVLTYSLFMGCGYFAKEPWHLPVASRPWGWAGSGRWAWRWSWSAGRSDTSRCWPA